MLPKWSGIVISRGVKWGESLDIPRKKHFSQDVIFAVAYSGEIVTTVGIVPVCLFLSLCLCFCQPLSLSLFLLYAHPEQWFLVLSTTGNPHSQLQRQKILWKHIGLINEGKLLVTITFIANQTYAPSVEAWRLNQWSSREGPRSELCRSY